MSIKRLTTHVVYSNRWMTVREDEIERDDGSHGIFGIVDKPDFALIIPQTQDGNFVLVEQYRYPVEGRFWEFPQGSWEDNPNVSAEDLARAELQEETGFLAGEVRPIGHLYEAYGYSSQAFFVYVASNLKAGAPNRSLEEQDMRAGTFSKKQLEKMITSGQIKDSPTLAAYTLYLLNSS